MLRLLARHADMWNTCWLGQPPGPLFERRQKLEEACVAEGRDPSTVGVTVGVSVAYPDPSQPAKPVEHPERALRGSPEAVAAGLREYERLGVNHVICALDQRNSASVEWLGLALKIWRDAGPPTG
jgi:alkanesulfonate monooxygenase SsuD/methylene tetrahydromethanopterin reductase-like flavin-dependent oxidoreductase (luciferase family)